MDSACRLMLIEAKFEVHAHHCEIFSTLRQHNIERAFVLISRTFKQSENSLRISKDIFRALKPRIARWTQVIAASVERAALAPLLSLSCLPALIARNGI